MFTLPPAWISTGEVDWLPYLKDFYAGDKGLETQVHTREAQIDATEARTVVLNDLEAKVRIGRYGPYIEMGDGEESVRASIPADVPPADLDEDQIERIIKQKVEGPDKVGLHPDTGEPIFLRIGPYGPYVQLGEATDDNPNPKRASLPKGMKAEDITLESAVGLLRLPRLLGEHPQTGKPIKASQGRFGPYVVHDQGKDGKDYRSIKGDDNVLTISLERALELLAQPKTGRGRGKATPLKELGNHPNDGEMIAVFNGPYGHYVKHGKVNASVPEGVELESITLEQALEWIAAKALAKGGKAKKGSTSKSGTSKSSTAKSGTTKKSTKSGTSTRTTKTAAASKASGTKRTTKATTKTSTTKKSTTRQSTSAKAQDDAAEAKDG
jgi:DNA topoisomerase-1